MTRRSVVIISLFASFMMIILPISAIIITASPEAELEAELEAEPENFITYGLADDLGIINPFTWVRTSLGKGFVNLGNFLLGVNSPSGAVSDQEDVNKILRDAFAYTVQTNYQTAVEMFGSLVSNHALTLSFVRAYYSLQAEAYASSIWSENLSYSGDRVLIGSNYVYDMSLTKFNMSATMLQFSQKWNEIFVDTVTNKSGTYGPMQMGFSWGSNQIYSSGTYMDIADYVTPTATNDLVYIAVVDDDTVTVSGRNNMYVFGSGTPIITNASTGSSYSLSVGINDLEALDVTSGWYHLSTGFTYAGNLMPSSEIDGLYPNASLVLMSGSNIALAVKSGDAYSVLFNNVSYVASDITMSVKFDGTAKTQNLIGVLDAYQEVWDVINRNTRSIVDSGYSAWLIFDAIGSSSSLIRPSSILASMQNNTSISPELLSAYYSLALQTLSQYGSSISPYDFTVSKESSSLFMYGNIYYEGNLLYEGAVFMPFVTEEVTLKVGSIRQWEASGTLMIFASGLSSVSDWDGSLDYPKILEMDKRFSTQLYNIINEGVEVSSVTLTIDKMVYIGMMDLDYLIDPPEISVEEKTKYVTIILILFGALLILLSFFIPGFSIKVILWIIAGICIAIGWFAPELLAGFF